MLSEWERKKEGQREETSDKKEIEGEWREETRGREEVEENNDGGKVEEMAEVRVGGVKERKNKEGERLYR